MEKYDMEITYLCMSACSEVDVLNAILINTLYSSPFQSFNSLTALFQRHDTARG